MSQYVRPDRDESVDLRTLAGRMLRAVRHHRGLSQRDLADLAQVRRETVGRIEADRVVPRLDTLLTVLAGAGFGLVLVDHQRRPLELRPERDVLFDRCGRRFPSHLSPFRTPAYMAKTPAASWWGWHRIAWPGELDRVPEYTYWRRPRLDVVTPLWHGSQRIWDDAT